ncbi:hypothetical protein LOTGIDRAFT_175602 [Lottia gigantea]|uniref:Uncharacterized protein n=1 Tax=Lottia gigantea TaxID=225164 RepID=V4A8T1_LOTGI|nr:hypothetical protein LOTGIDRAFT_175602 [Lottia gigantea]ESO93167.1 hypothetical protein LOTGIDRAFT_175602 [Lottia gigantea]
MDTTPAPSRATTLPNQTPKQARSSPTPSPAGIANHPSVSIQVETCIQTFPPRTRSQCVPNATILTTTKPVPITPSTTIISATKPYYHQTKDKSLWKLPALQKSTLISGSSNLNRITKTSSDTEIHSYPGAQIHHIQSILESYDHDPKPTTITLHVANLIFISIFNTGSPVFTRSTTRSATATSGTLCPDTNTEYRNHHGFHVYNQLFQLSPKTA